MQLLSNPGAFADFQELRIVKMTIKKCDPMAFSQNLFIRTLTMVDVTIIDVSNTFLRPLHYVLERVLIETLPDHLGLNDLFNFKDSSWRITAISFHSNSPKFRLISATNFTKLNQLNNIRLQKCGIEIIEWGAFDQIARQLWTLNLMDNKLKHLQYDLFNYVIEQSSSLILPGLHFNQLVCDCNSHDIESIFIAIFMSTNLRSKFQYFPCDFQPADEQVLVTELEFLQNCTNLQILRPANVCLNELKFGVYSYPRFRIKLNAINNTIDVRTELPRKYRLWINKLMSFSEYNAKWGYMEQKCPRMGLLQTSVRCFIFVGIEHRIPWRRIFEHMNLTQFCINYVSRGMKKIWPLHCITVNQAVEAVLDEDIAEMLMVLVFVASGLTGIFGSIVLVWLVVWFKGSRADERKNDGGQGGGNQKGEPGDYRVEDHVRMERPDYESLDACYYEIIDYSAIGCKDPSDPDKSGNVNSVKST